MAGSRVDLARSGIGVAVRAGASRPDIGSVDAFKRALRQARSIAHSSSASGVYLESLFQRLGIAAELAPKIRKVEGEPVGQVVARGEAEIGFQQVSELLPVAGIDYVGPLPAEIQEITVFAAGIPVGAPHPEAARASIEFLTVARRRPHHQQVRDGAKRPVGRNTANAYCALRSVLSVGRNKALAVLRRLDRKIGGQDRRNAAVAYCALRAIR